MRHTLKWTFKWDGGNGLDLPGSGWEQETGNFECCNKPLIFIKIGEFLDQLRKY